MEDSPSIESKEDQEGTVKKAYSLPTLVIVAVVSFAAGALAFWSMIPTQGPDDAEGCFYELLKNGMPGGSAMAICDNMFPSVLNLPRFPEMPPDSGSVPAPENPPVSETPPASN